MREPSVAHPKNWSAPDADGDLHRQDRGVVAAGLDELAGGGVEDRRPVVDEVARLDRVAIALDHDGALGARDLERRFELDGRVGARVAVTTMPSEMAPDGAADAHRSAAADSVPLGVGVRIWGGGRAAGEQQSRQSGGGQGGDRANAHGEPQR